MIKKLVVVICLLLCIVALRPAAQAQGTWAPLVNQPGGWRFNPELLSDGTVVCDDGNQNWYKLTPDIHGSYVNGTWSQITTMQDSRLYMSSQVLTDGRLYIAGGEYGTGSDTSEVYNPVTNSWTYTAPNSEPGNGFFDAESVLLTGGLVLNSDRLAGTEVYDPFINAWENPINTNLYMNELSWVKLPDESILSYQGSSIRYIPSMAQWIADASSTVNLNDSADEQGPSFLLPNGKAFFIGALPVTLTYTPAGNTNPGTWAGGTIPNNLSMPDAPAVEMPNGKILCVMIDESKAFQSGKDVFFEYDYTAGSWTEVNGPTGGASDNTTYYVDSFLALPDGNVLYCNGNGNCFVYQPGGSQLFAQAPVITNITENADGRYQLTGTGLNGISTGASYGDDLQNDSNYPIVTLTASNGNVYHARTYNWSSTGVQTGNKVITTQFTPPLGVPSGTYTLTVSASGLISAPVTFMYTANYITNGTYSFVDGPGLALDNPNGGGSGNGTNQVTYTGANQQWTITRVSGLRYKILSANGLALTGSAATAQLIVTAYTGAVNQLWTFTGNGANYDITNVSSGENMDDFGGGSGAIVRQFTADNTNPNQSWTLTPVLASGLTYKMVDIPGFAMDDPNAGGSGTGTDQVKYSGPNQQWTITWVSGNQYKIISTNGLALTGAASNAQQLTLTNYTGAANQLWAFSPNGIYYNVTNVGNGYNLDDFSGGAGVSVIQSTADSNNPNQRWMVTPVLPSGGVYAIDNINSGLGLDDPNAGGSGTAVDQLAFTGINQQWTVTSVGSGLYKIINGASNLALTGATPYSQLSVNTYTGAGNQQWSFAASGSSYVITNGSTWQVLNDIGANTSPGAPIGQAVPDEGTYQAWTLASGAAFSISANPSSLAIDQGANGSSTINVTPSGGFSSSVTFSASGLPSGVTATFSPTSSPTGTTLTLTASNTAAIGVATVTVKGTSGSLVGTTTISLTVNPDFTLSANPASVTINQRTSGTSTVNVTDFGGFAGSVSFAASGLPAGVTASFSPGASTTGTVVTLSANSTATTGPATVTITGTSGVFTYQTTIALTVNGNFTLAPNPTSLTINQRLSKTSTISVVPTGGFTGPVIFSATGLPSGVTASFSPASSPSSTVMTLSASGTAVTGVTTVTVTGTSGVLTNSTTIGLTVLGNYTLSASPNGITLKQAQSTTSTIAVSTTGGFNSSVAFTASGLPSGVTASFSPTSSPTSSILTLTASPTAAIGPVTVVVTGTSGALTQTATIALTIAQGWTVAGFTVTPTTVVGGSPVSGTVTLSDPAPVGGEPVSLSVPSASAPFVSCPATVVVPVGQMSLTFTGIQTHTATSTQSVTLTATIVASSKSASLTSNFVAGGTQAGGLQFFSLPWAYHDTLNNIFEFPLPSGQISAYSAASLSYIIEGGTLTNPTPVTLTPGNGYWAIFPSGGESLMYLGMPASSTVPTTITLYPGYNAIGDPYTTPVYISSLTFGSAHTTFAQATTAAKKLIDPTLDYFVQGLSSTSGSYSATGAGQALTPGKGYWIYAYSAITVTFPLPAALPAPPPPAVTTTAPTKLKTGGKTTF